MNRQFELERMERLLNDLEKLIVQEQTEITDYEVKNGKELSDAAAPAQDWEKGRITEPWTKTDDHRWFRTVIQIPESMEGQKVVLAVTTGREGQWDATNPQMLLYLDGQLVQAADVNHRELTVSEQAVAGESHELVILAYSGMLPGDLIIHTWLQSVEERIRSICYDIRVPLDTAKLLYQVDEDNCGKILLALRKAGDLLDLRTPYSDSFYRSLSDAKEALQAAFYHSVDESAPVVSAVGHTHIDIAWLWTVSQTREKALRSFSTVLALMKQYPEYKFMSSQPILYQFVKEQDPRLYEEIRQRVDEGRWEVDGAMWLEADCNLTGGESLVRQILKGHAFIRDEFGKESRSLWLPDAFGYSAALPQILKKSGIPYFMTTKISWNQYNQLPNDMFTWRGIDGSEVFAYMPTACNFDKAAGSGISFSDRRNTTTYTGIIDPNMVLGTHRRFQNHDLTDNTLMLFGFGDGGGGPTAEMLENAKRMKYGLPGLPRLQLEGEITYFDRLYKQTARRADLPTWDGELYFEYHRGTLTSMAKNKRNNRKVEILYEQLETLAFMAQGTDYEYPADTVRRGWDVILLNQFHDIIPGTCIEAVYENTDKEYAEILGEGKREAQKAADRIAAQLCKQEPEDAIVVVNTTGYEREDVVTVSDPGDKIVAIRTETGNECPLQRTEKGIIFFAEGIPAAGAARYYPVYSNAGSNFAVLQSGQEMNIGTSDMSARTSWDGTFENDFFRIAFNEKMQIVSLVEKTDGRDYIREGSVGNELCTYEDRPMHWDNWDIDEYYKRKPYQADRISEPVVKESGTVRTIVEYTLAFGDSVVTQQVILYRHLPRIDFHTTAVWNTHHVLLRVNFPIEVQASRAAFEIQFGNLERETTCNQSWDSAKFEVCGHKWADLSEYSGGVSLLNDCKYGYGVKNGNLSLTLINSGTYPNENADIGFHEFTYSIYPHHGRWQEARTVEMAYDLNVPLYVSIQRKEHRSETTVKHVQTPFSVLSCDRKECFLETVKRSEDGRGWIIRMYENLGSRGTAHLRFRVPVKDVEECDLLERKIQALPLADGTCTINYRPYEIKTFRIV